MNLLYRGMHMKAIVIEQYGDADKLIYKDVPKPTPNAGEALIKIEAAGINFIDIYHRTGLYPLPLPFIPGVEAAGVIEGIYGDTSDFVAGDRVAYVMQPGAYAEYASVPLTKLVKIPLGMDSQVAAAAMLQGMTSHYLVTSVYQLKAGDRALIHAGAGGVGLLLLQMARQIGAHTIATVSTNAKAELAKEAGADYIIHYTKDDFETEIHKLTNGSGCQVVYDSVGKDTFLKSLNCLAPRGMLVLYGQSSGSAPVFDPGLLSKGGSLFLTRPSLPHYIANRNELKWRSNEIFDWIKTGKLKLRIEKTFKLSEVVEAHKQLEGRKTTGKVLLLP